MKFNLLKEARSIRNIDTCRYDSLNGYTTNFSINGNVDGWDIYSNIYMYGVWNSVLFGTSADKSCFIGRTNPFLAIQAERYYTLKLTMKLTLPDDYGKKTLPTKGKVQWSEASNSVWLDDNTKEFDLNLTDQWYTYIINLGEAKYWIGNINNLRIYPIVDGFEDIKFMIKSIVIDSINEFTCLNTQCSYYHNYTHPCTGIGERASITSGIPMKRYTTISGISDSLIINIDDYGDECVHLGNNSQLTGMEMAKVLTEYISRVNVGQYAYVDVLYLEEEHKLTIKSGFMSDKGTIKVAGSAAKALGFTDSLNNDVSIITIGKSAASGFDFGSSRRLKGFELNALTDSNVSETAYYHNPVKYNVEAGRVDFFKSMSANDSPNADKLEYYTTIDACNKLIIDASHPIDDSGILEKIWVNGKYLSNISVGDNYVIDGRYVFDGGDYSDIQPKVCIVRPNKYGEATIIAELDIAIEDKTLRYTMEQVTFNVDCNVMVNKGDLIGFFNIEVLAPFSTKNQAINGVYFQVDCGRNTPSKNTKFKLGAPMGQGVVGISYYARSNRLQTDIQLDIDMGRRINIDEISIYGKEYNNFFEYNVACCLDVNWDVDCHNTTHWHKAGEMCMVVWHYVYFEHRNIPYGVECLSDCITTPDNGQVGDNEVINTIGPATFIDNIGYVANSDPDYYSGIKTYGKHSYCYVNGDAEWLNSGCQRSELKPGTKAEFQAPWIANVYGFEFDPISYYLIFPANKSLNVHKSIMYFKEGQNFKRYSLSYYLGEGGAQGNAEETHFNYVPSYNSITLDGVKITLQHTDGDSLTQLYSKTLFKNPIPWALPEFQDGVCTNWDIYQTIMNTEVNVLQHEFDPVSCKGFKIHTTWHRSTKLTELELYSKTPVSATLLDNVRIQSSIYGDDWQELSFVLDEIDDKKISSQVLGYPRYFRLLLQSQDIFELNEISASITKEPMKSLFCNNTVLQQYAPKYEITKSVKLNIENVYDIPLNLIVNIPNQLFREKFILSWIRFDSIETAINGEIGPGAVIRKSDDYDLFLAQGQIAINTPSYYLKNLIDGKKSYVYENNNKWAFYKDLVHGEDINYSNNTTSKKTSIKFKPVSAKFFKLSIFENRSSSINNLKLYSNLDTSIISININNSFEDIIELDPSLWGGNSNSIDNNRFKLTSNPGVYSYARSKFFIDGDFEIYAQCSVDITNFISNSLISGPMIKVISVSNSLKAIQTYYYCTYYSEYNYNIYTKFDCKDDGEWESHGSIQSYSNYYYYNYDYMYNRIMYIKLKRVGNTFSSSYSINAEGLYGRDDSAWHNIGSYTYTEFSSKVFIDMALWNDSTSPGQVTVYFNDIRLLNGSAFFDNSTVPLVANNVDVDNIFIQCKLYESSNKFKATFNNNTNTINSVSLVEDDFSDGVWGDKWNAFLGTNPINTFIEKNNALYPIVAAGNNIYIEKEFLPGAVSYEAEVRFNLDFPIYMDYMIEFLSSDNEVVFIFSLCACGETGKLLIETATPIDQKILQKAASNDVFFTYNESTFSKTVDQFTDGFIFTCEKVYKTFNYIKLTNTDKSITYYNGENKEATFDRVSKIRILYSNNSTNDIKDYIYNLSTSYISFKALPYLSDIEPLVFGFSNNTSLDTIEFVHNLSEFKDVVISISNTDNDDYIEWARSFKYIYNEAINNHAIYGDSLCVNHNTLYNLIGDSTDLGLDASYSHWIAYDFGVGNSKKVNYICYTSSYLNTTWAHVGENIWNICKVYGLNEYKVDFVREFDTISQLTIDLSNATFLTEFIINHSNDGNVSNNVNFINETAFRFIVFFYPYADDKSNSSLFVRSIQLGYFYENYSSNGLSITNSNYNSYFAIDLEQTHNIDFFRNYGPKSNLLNIFNESVLDFSDSDTDDINEVKWEEYIPTVLFNFNNYSELIDLNRVVYKNGSMCIEAEDCPIQGSNYLRIGIKDQILFDTGYSWDYSYNGSVEVYRNFGPIDCTGLTRNNGILSIELKVSGASNIDRGQIEIGSNYDHDIEEWQYVFDVNGNDPINLIGQLTDSYKVFNIPLSYFGKSAGSDLDVSKIRRIRFYYILKESQYSVSYMRNATLVYPSNDDATLALDNFSELNLTNEDFTIDFWCKRSQFIQEGVLGQVSDAPSSSSFSIIFSSTNYLIVTLYAGSAIYILSSTDSWIDREWHHVAVCRKEAIISLYIDGILQNSKNIGYITVINETVAQLIIGKVDYDYFSGWLDEFRIIVGNCEWEHDFDVPTTEYNANKTIGLKSSARWVRIALKCGDGVNRNLNKIGIYPDVSIPYIPSGGYNCEWECLGSSLSNYNIEEKNLSFGASVLEEVININFDDESLINWYDLKNEQEGTEWGIVDSTKGGYALGYITTEVPCNEGPIFIHPWISNGSQVSYIEYYYYSSGAGGGISFIDAFDIEILAIVTTEVSLIVSDINGWHTLYTDSNNCSNNWCRVKTMFNWIDGIVNIEWESANNISKVYSISLKDSTDIAKLQIRGFSGMDWGGSLIDMKFDSITILPSVPYMYTFKPINCLIKDPNLYGYENSWGFPANIKTPCLIIDLNSTYNIDKFIVYSRPEQGNYDYIINDFDIYVAPTLSGTFDLIVSETDFSETFDSPGDNVYELSNAVSARLVKLVIKKYTKPDTPMQLSIYSQNGGTDYVVIDGGFLRNFEIWQSSGFTDINSEDNPIVCMDLKDQFNLTSHSIEGPDVINSINYSWSNENEFFQFSADNVDDPSKVAFSKGYEYSILFSYIDEFFVDSGEDGTFVLETNVFLSSGQYLVLWETYNASEIGGISLVIVGINTVVLSNAVSSTSWLIHQSELFINVAGYYNINIKSTLENNTSKWGVRNIFFKNFNYTARWAVLRRNTAENFVWDNSSYKSDIDNKEGKDFLKKIKFFADGKHRPTEYYWFWKSKISNLENDAINTKVGKRSLKINYPNSELVDVISFLEGDFLGYDKNFFIKDFLCFWFFIEDIDKLVISEGGFAFGSFNGYNVSLTDIPSASQAVYIWNFSDLELKTGWNYIRLKFNDFSSTIPTVSSNTGRLNTVLNFKEHLMSSFGLMFKGKGEAFYMLLDGLKVERNWFDEDIIYGDKGLCLAWKDYAEIPLAGISARYGTIEMWIKLYSNTIGVDIFNYSASRTLFTLVDTNNISISLSIRSSSWFEIGLGNTTSDYKVLIVDTTQVDIASNEFGIDDILHMALVWSNTPNRMEGDSTIRLYINGNLVLNSNVTWDVGDNKNAILRLGGGNTYLANNDDSDGSAIFSNVKFYNYCKTSFNIEEQYPKNNVNITPNKFVQISTDNIEFLESRNENLPLEFEQVKPGEKIPIYIRVDKSSINDLDKFTGFIDVEWKVPV